MAQRGEPTSSDKPDFSQLFKEDYGVFLLRGKNSFGDKIYSYVKVTFANVDKLANALKKGLSFKPSDFGEVVAAGTGEPPPEIQAEIAAQYPMLDQAQIEKTVARSPEMNEDDDTSSSTSDIVLPQKNWDEY